MEKDHMTFWGSDELNMVFKTIHLLGHIVQGYNNH